jgi:GT2 family glycosyltransferase
LGNETDHRPLISVVSTVRNERQHIVRLLESLRAQEPPFEVIVVDADSRDGTFEVLSEYAARFPSTFRALKRPGSRGIGRNEGARAARGKYVAFIDGDCFADSNWLHELRRALDSREVAAGQTVAVGKPRYGTLERVELFQSGYDVTYPTCNLAYRRELFERLGGFDPRFITAEDIDLNLRAVRSGAAIQYVPTAVVYHQMRANFLRFLYQAFWNGYGRKQLTEKHGSLWGRYRVRRLISGQRGAIAWARLTAALGGYSVRVVTGRGRRLATEGSDPADPRPT